MYHGADGARLELTLKMPKTSRLTFVVKENEWGNYRGPSRTFVCEREIQGSDAVQTITFEARDFTAADGPLKSWVQIDQLGSCAHNPGLARSATPLPLWNGPSAEFVRLEWE